MAGLRKFDEVPIKPPPPVLCVEMMPNLSKSVLIELKKNSLFFENLIHHVSNFLKTGTKKSKFT